MLNVQSTAKKNNDFIKEFNRFDRIIENDNHQVKELENDIHESELRFGSSLNEKLDDLKRKRQEIVLTLVSLRKGKNNNKIFLSEKKVLLDYGSSHIMCSPRCAQGRSNWSEN